MKNNLSVLEIINGAKVENVGAEGSGLEAIGSDGGGPLYMSRGGNRIVVGHYHTTLLIIAPREWLKLRDKSVPLKLERIIIINIFMAILVTTLCERADNHGGRRRPTATLWPHSRR
jgi:hypothetical protein